MRTQKRKNPKKKKKRFKERKELNDVIIKLTIHVIILIIKN